MCYDKLYKAKGKVTFQSKSSRKKKHNVHSKRESPSFMCYNKLYKAKGKVTFCSGNFFKKLKAFQRKRDAIWKLYSKRKKKKSLWLWKLSCNNP